MDGLGKRVALVIGNERYKSMRRLRNAVNDASAIAGDLTEIGYGNAVPQIDLELGALYDALFHFYSLLDGAGVALLYFSGHGVQVGGQNFLVPVELSQSADKFLNAAYLNKVAVALDEVVATMKSKAKVSVVILDACRDDPFNERGSHNDTPKRQPLTPNVGNISTDGNALLILFSTQPGKLASDGEGELSPFTEALHEHIKSPGKPFAELVHDVGVRVEEITSKLGTPQYPDVRFTGSLKLAIAPFDPQFNFCTRRATN